MLRLAEGVTKVSSVSYKPLFDNANLNLEWQVGQDEDEMFILFIISQVPVQVG